MASPAQAVVPGTGTVTFKYDPFGRRIQKSGPNGTTNYLYDGPNLLEEVDQSGNVIARYAQGPGIDQPLSESSSGATSYYDGDGLGSITSLTNASGTTAATYVYDAFGNLSASTGTKYDPFGRRIQKSGPLGTTNYLYHMFNYDTEPGIDHDAISSVTMTLWEGGPGLATPETQKNLGCPASRGFRDVGFPIVDNGGFVTKCCGPDHCRFAKLPRTLPSVCNPFIVLALLFMYFCAIRGLACC